ncbi:ERI1 exoribonuclease 2-like isoform X2 [Limulus polyphemus]|uniref:ERI1 exoribonuclease 2-like isoform X2 n=1 Tax=Limulus polyphemus TaxID=6850 RepID=A0ABM1BHR2_LIMPO|nr:ERI1 exoribonuclease 2-like isoform X2 [Limulus polyphemus]
MATKKLAKELGLLRQHNGKKKQEMDTQHSRSEKEKGQFFDYLIVIDFESTCWEDKGKAHLCQEIIEFPAVFLNLVTGDIIEQFHTYIQPREHPKLSDFCQKLTGISQDQVDEGIPLPTCLGLFKQWLKNLVQKYHLVFHSNYTSSTNGCHCTFGTWTSWDLGVCLHSECKRKQLNKPAVLNSWIDLKITYRKFYSRTPNGLRGAIEDLGLCFEGREHSGIVDSMNTAKLAFKMAQDGCYLNITHSDTLKHPVTD